MNNATIIDMYHSNALYITYLMDKPMIMILCDIKSLVAEAKASYQWIEMTHLYHTLYVGKILERTLLLKTTD